MSVSYSDNANSSGNITISATIKYAWATQFSTTSSVYDYWKFHDGVFEVTCNGETKTFS